MDEQVASSKRELWGLSLKDLFYKYLRYGPLIILCVIVSMAGAFIYLRYATEIYRASGVMIFQDDKKQTGTDVVEDIFLGSNKTQNVQNEIEILRSRPLLARVVKNLGLNFGITAKGKIKDANVYKQSPFSIQAISLKDSTKPSTFKVVYQASAQFTINDRAISYGQAFNTPAGTFRLNKLAESEPGLEFDVVWQPTGQVAAQLAAGIGILPKAPGAGILTVSMMATNPVYAADVVNALMFEYGQMNIEQNNYSTDQMLNFINSRLVILNKELDTSQQKLLVYQQQNDIINVEIQSAGYFNSVSESDRAIVAQQTRLSVAELLDEYLSDKTKQFERMATPSSLGLDDEVLNGLVVSYNKAQLDRKALLEGSVPPGNPVVKQSEATIEALRQTIVENIKGIKASFNSALTRLRRGTEKSEASLRSLPFKVKEYIELKRQVDIKLELVKQLEGKREETAIARSSTVSGSRVIQEADPGLPVEPNRQLVKIIGLLVGVIAPVIFIFVKELLNDKVTGRADVERITLAPVLGEIGHSFSEDSLIISKSSRSMVAEQFRIIRSNLQYVIGKVERPVIMTTSSFSGEGKSFVSTNMGAVMAVAGKKTVILEFDLRKPKVLSGLKMGKLPGISNYLVGTAALKDIIVPVKDTPNLFVLPCGPIPPNPSELLLEPQIDVMFQYLKANFDVVIIDTAPVGMVSDAIALGKHADCTMYLVRQGHTYKKQIALIDDLYTSKKLPPLSIIINDVKMKSGYGYYGYGRYGYGYTYGGGYYEEESPKTLWGRLKSNFFSNGGAKNKVS